MRRSQTIAVAVLLLSGASAGRAWGPDGHRIVGEIAAHYLSPAAEREVEKLLERGPFDDLATVGNWADFHARRYRSFDWALRLHYIDVDPTGAEVDLARDCPGGECIVGAIRRFGELVADRSLPVWERAEHFRFLVHFIEDIHQPLHVVHPDGEGGNRTPVTLWGRETQMHRVWDSGLIRHRLDAFREGKARGRQGIEPWKQWAYELRLEIEPAEIEAWQASIDPEVWAGEALAPARELTFSIRSGQTLDDTYYQAALPVIERQLKKAAIRLATTLNHVFDCED